MKRPKVIVLGSLTVYFLTLGIALASNCANRQCQVLVLDAPFSETVYDPGRFRAHQTNADAICDILRSTMGSKVQPKSLRTDPHWLDDRKMFREAVSPDPDLIVMHTSAFFSPLSEQQTVQNLEESLRYLVGISRAKFLVYGTNFFLVGGLDRFKKALVNAAPQVKGRISVVELSSRSFDAPVSKREISRAVTRILNL